MSEPAVLRPMQGVLTVAALAFRESARNRVLHALVAALTGSILIKKCGLCGLRRGCLRGRGCSRGLLGFLISALPADHGAQKAKCEMLRAHNEAEAAEMARLAAYNLSWQSRTFFGSFGSGGCRAHSGRRRAIAPTCTPSTRRINTNGYIDTYLKHKT